MAEALTRTAGRTLEARDEADDAARHAQPRAENPPALGTRPKSIGDRLAREIDDGIDRGVAGDLIEAGDQPERRPQLRRLRRIARQHDHVMASALASASTSRRPMKPVAPVTSTQ